MKKKHIAQYLRCYTESVNGPKRRPRGVRGPEQSAQTVEAQDIQEIGRPYDGWCLTFDCETTTDERQTLRFGVYELHGISRDERIRRNRAGTLDRAALDTLHESGIFYNPAVLTPSEITAVEAFARHYQLRCMTVTEFVTGVFYPWVYHFKALCVGHNLAFDLTRLATRGGVIDRGRFNGGFWRTLCNCGRDECFDHPPIRVKHLGHAKNQFDFRAVTMRLDDGSVKVRNERGRFLDTMTLGRALLGPGALSLDGLGRRAQVPDALLKTRWQGEHGQPITEEYLAYCLKDVEATWALYQRLRELYRRHGVSRPIWQIYSEASLAKAYLHDLGVPHFLEQHLAFPKEIIGHAMEAYYGGRCEVRRRLQPAEVITGDFKSEYPTVMALMGLQDLLLAKRIEIRIVTNEIRDFLSSLAQLGPRALQDPSFWRSLRVFVQVAPDEDLLPVRSTFGDGLAATNIALAYVSGRKPTWYALPDVVNSILNNERHPGKVPEILDAFELVPVDGTVPTNPWTLFGDERYQLDLTTQDFAMAVIDLRTRVDAERAEVEAKRKQSVEGSRESAMLSDQIDHLDSLQRALKLLANSLYGILVEVNQSEYTADAKPVVCYDQTTHTIRAHVVEEPGSYFAGPLGALIPAGGRLLLGLAERVARDLGLSIAYCDTDALAFVCPDGMPRDEFERRVQQVVDFFTPLSPYAGQPPILQIEKHNFWEGKLERLYCLAISAKRYVLYNRCSNGTFRIRKFSSHGTGTWRTPKGYQPRADIPEPWPRGDDGKADSFKLGGPRYLYDLWYHAIEQAEAGKTRIVLDDAGWLNEVAEMQVSISTKHLYQQFAAHFPGLCPFNFLTVLPAFTAADIRRRQITESLKFLDGDPDRYDGLVGVPFYRSPEGIRRLDNHELVDIEPKTLRECLQDYFGHPEAKAADPHGIGRLERLDVVVVDHFYIGKETNQIWEEIEEDGEGVLPAPDAQEFSRSGLGAAVRAHGVRQVFEAVAHSNPHPIPLSTLYTIANGRLTKAKNVRRLVQGLDRCPPVDGCCADTDTDTGTDGGGGDVPPN